MALPKQLPLERMQSIWKEQIDPLIANPLNNGNILKSISLSSGTNVINHKLGRNLQGWYTTRVRAEVSLYDQQDTNQTPQLTLILIASAPAIIDLAVF